MKELLPVGLFGPDYFDVEPDELIDIGNAGKETIRYVRSDLLQKQIEEAVMKERERCANIAEAYQNTPPFDMDSERDRMAHYSTKTCILIANAIRNGEEA